MDAFFGDFLIKLNRVVEIDKDLNFGSSFLILISLNMFVTLSPYNSAHSSIVDYPTNISQTAENIIIEQDSLNPQIVTLGEKIYTVWQEVKGPLVDIYLRRSTDGGASFDKTINLSNIPASPGSKLDDYDIDSIIEDTRYPSIVASGSSVYVIWLGLENVTEAHDQVKAAERKEIEDIRKQYTDVSVSVCVNCWEKTSK